MMKTVLFSLPALIASTQAQAFVPVHGCEWVPETTAVTNFTFFHGTSKGSTLDYVKWEVPAHRVSCYASNPSSTGLAKPIGNPGTSSTVPCTASGSDPTTGRFLVSADDSSGKNATLNFQVYVQCAADIFAFHYQADFPLACSGDPEGNATCVPKGNATARVTSEEYLPPIRPPPPPTHWV